MARAYSIWLVVQDDYDGMQPIAAFTVKREMIAFLRKQRREDLFGHSVRRLFDGHDVEPDEFSIEELLA
jgi:hypothetical protein